MSNPIASPVYQYAPTVSARLKPADLRFCFYYVKVDEIKRREVLSLGLYVDKALELGAIELKSIKDSVDNWMFTSPILDDGNMSLSTDGEVQHIPGYEPTPEDVNFIYGHHAFNELELTSNIPVKIFTKETEGFFYKKVLSILNDQDEILEGEVEYAIESLGGDVESDEDDDDDCDVVAPVKKIETVKESGKLTKEAREAIAQQIRPLADINQNEDELRTAQKRRSLKGQRGNLVKMSADLEDLMIESDLGIDREYSQRLQFHKLITDQAGPIDWQSFLVSLSAKDLGSTTQKRRNKIISKIKNRPLSVLLDYVERFDLFFISDVRKLKTELNLPANYEEMETRDAGFAKDPDRWLFIPRYGQVINPANGALEWKILDFNVRDLDSSTKATGQKYRVWYPYKKCRTKHDPMYRAYEDLRPLTVYAGIDAYDSFEYQYSQESQLSAGILDRRWKGRTIIMEGELNSMLAAIMNPAAVIIPTSTSSIPPEIHDKIMRTISPSSSVGVMFDDGPKTDIGVRVLLLDLDDSPKSCPSTTKYVASPIGLPSVLVQNGYDYENLIQASLAESPTAAHEYFVATGMESNFETIRYYGGQLKKEESVQKVIDLLAGSDDKPSSMDIDVRQFPECKYRRLSIKEMTRRQIEALTSGGGHPDIEMQSKNEIQIADLKKSESILELQLRDLSREIFDRSRVHAHGEVAGDDSELRLQAHLKNKGEINKRGAGPSSDRDAREDESAPTEEIKYFITRDDISKDPELEKYYEDDAPRFRSIMYRNSLPPEQIKELREKELQYFKAREDLQERLVRRLQLSYGFNPSQELVRELGLSLEQDIDRPVRHINLAQGASGGKTTGLMEAVLQYYQEVCDAIERTNMPGIRKLIRDLLSSPKVDLAFAMSAEKFFKMKQVDLESGKLVGKYFYLVGKLPADVRITIEENVQEAIIRRLRNFYTFEDLKVSAEGKLFLTWLEERAPGCELLNWLKTRTGFMSISKDLVSKLEKNDGDYQLYEALTDLILETMRILPADAKDLLSSPRDEADTETYLKYRKLERRVSPLSTLSRCSKLYEPFLDVAGRLQVAVTDEQHEQFRSILRLQRSISERGMVLAAKSITEVDHYYFVLRNVHGIDKNFIRRFHSDSHDGAGLSMDDDLLVNTPIVLCTHKRMESATNLFEYRDNLGVLRKRKIVVIDEAFESGRSVDFSVTDLLRANKHLFEDRICEFHPDLRYLEMKVEDFRDCIDAWLESKKLDRIQEGSTILSMLMSVHYPRLQFLKMSYTARLDFFEELNDVQRNALHEAAEILVTGLQSKMVSYLTDKFPSLLKEYDKLAKKIEESEDVTDEMKERMRDMTPLVKFFSDLRKYYDDFRSLTSAGLDTSHLVNPSIKAEDQDQKEWDVLQSLIVHELHRVDGQEGARELLVRLPNLISRQLRNANTMILDATSSMIMHSPDALGAVRSLIDSLDQIAITAEKLPAGASEDEKYAYAVRNQKIREAQLMVLEHALKSGHVTTKLAADLSDKLNARVVDRTDFEGAFIRDTPDPVLSSERFGKFVYNGGYLGYAHDYRNPYDLGWTVIKIPGPALTLHSWKSIKLPLSRVSADASKKFKVNGSPLEISRGMMENNLLEELRNLVSGPYATDVVRTLVGSNKELLSIYLKICYLTQLQKFVLDNVEKLKQNEGQENHEYLVLPDSWDVLEMVMEDPTSTDPGTKVESTVFDSGENGEYENLHGIASCVVEYNSIVRRSRVRFELDRHHARVVSSAEEAMDICVAMSKELADSDKKLHFKLRFLSVAVSLDAISKIIVDYLMQPDIVYARQMTADGDWVEERKPRALNVFVWRRLNYAIHGVLNEETLDFFPTMLEMLDEATNVDKMKVHVQEATSEQVDSLSKDLETRIREVFKRTDYDNFMSSELRPLPDLLRRRVMRILESMEPSPRRDLLVKELEDYLMITHHGSSLCKATSAFQHATGTMVIGDHLIPESVIEEERIDCGGNYSNEGQASALLIQELYRGISRTGTIHQPAPIDLIAINLEDSKLHDMIYEHSAGQTVIRNWSRSAFNAIIDGFIRRRNGEKVGSLMAESDDENRRVRVNTMASTLWICLLYPQILEMASYYHGKAEDNSDRAVAGRRRLHTVPISLNRLTPEALELVRTLIKQSANELARFGVRVDEKVSFIEQHIVQLSTDNLWDIQLANLELLLKRTRSDMVKYLENKGSTDPADYFPYWDGVKKLIPALEVRDLISIL